MGKTTNKTEETKGRFSLAEKLGLGAVASTATSAVAMADPVTVDFSDMTQTAVNVGGGVLLLLVAIAAYYVAMKFIS